MDTWYKLYYKLPDDHQFGIFGKAVNRITAKIVKKHLDKTQHLLFANNPVKCGINKNEKRKRKLICSLTSFPARISDIHLCIETIFRQTYKADEIILWLASSQFPDHKLPESLVKMKDRGLTIRWCDEDLRSHKKYYYVLQEYRDDDIVLLDDDLYYPDRLLENLVNMAKDNPRCICATRAHKMLSQNGVLMPYRKWYHVYNKIPNESDHLFITSGPGTLIPGGVMPKELFNKEVFKNICFLADDVWLTLFAYYAKIRITTNGFYNKDSITIGKSQNFSLVSQNVIHGGNDRQIKDVIDYIKQLNH